MEHFQNISDYIQYEIDEIENEIADLEQKKLYTVQSRLDPMHEYSDEEFRKRFRLTKNSVIYLNSLIGKDLEPKVTRNGFTLSALDKILITLRYYAYKYFFSVDSTTLKLGVPSDDSEHDFSTDEGDDFRKENENVSSSSDDESGDMSSNRKRIKQKKVVHAQNDSTSNQSPPQLFQDLSPSFAMLPGLSNSTRQEDVSLMNSDQQLQIDQQIELVGQNGEEESNNANSFDHDDGNNGNLIYMRSNDPLPGNPVDYEFDIERQARLEQEAENEADQNRRLLAPRTEIRQRTRQPSKRQQNQQSFKVLGERQLQLVNLQIDYTKVLLENAKITQEKCKAELLLAERMNANNE